MEKEIYVAIIDRGIKTELIFLENEFVIDQLFRTKIKRGTNKHTNLDSLEFIEVNKIEATIKITNLCIDFVQEKVHSKPNKVIMDNLISKSELIFDCILDAHKMKLPLKSHKFDFKLNEELFESGDKLIQLFLNCPSIRTSDEDRHYENADIYVYKISFEYEVS